MYAFLKKKTKFFQVCTCYKYFISLVVWLIFKIIVLSFQPDILSND